jgi:AraC family transcriptional regulator
MLLRPGSIELGWRRSGITRFAYDAGEMILCQRHADYWIRTDEAHRLTLRISDAALRAASNEMSKDVELPGTPKLMDARIGALITAVNAERVEGFPSGRLFLDSVEQALAAALVDRYAVRRPSVRAYVSGLTPASLRKVVELVHAKMESELTLREMAESANLSVAHFSQMFRKSTGESPHQFVLRQRVERGMEMLRAPEARVLDVAIACGFKTEQHFARMFRRLCGASPTQYRQDYQR